MEPDDTSGQKAGTVPVISRTSALEASMSAPCDTHAILDAFLAQVQRRTFHMA